MTDCLFEGCNEAAVEGNVCCAQHFGQDRISGYEIKKYNQSKSEDDLVDVLIEIDTKIIKQSFCLSRELGVAAIKGALQGFREHIQGINPQFLASSNIMYRCYVVGLMQRVNSAVNKEYQEDVARAFLLPESIQTGNA